MIRFSQTDASVVFWVLTLVVLGLALVAAFLLLVMLSGCAVDPLERVQDDLFSRSLEAREASVETLSRRRDDRSLNLLVEALESDESLLELAGNALVLRGRRYDVTHPIHTQEWPKNNPVVMALGETVKKRHLDWPVRAKAVWCLGEVGNRKAAPYILKADASDSTRVAEEVALARDKLGFTDKGAALELLRDGTAGTGYRAEARWCLDGE